ncbi:DUF4382 domain-containing protein [Fluviicola taffensis]|uniref:Starch-binding domain-like protein n=1 Tax=Fluviicola taffensis (strain DSM 16823 / NCIMB 13979 / RW262) TaxID=755732 RepID=F2IF82_FLUTR|nr:DUF4382 domain-containing protein [Fluviicola taffensis]AEA43556.1 starch-binding domain-like protein [Fluviicola taffensis DSM 16823]
MKTLFAAVIASACLFAFSTGCKKKVGESRMTVKMVDAPGDFQQVNVEVLQVQVHHDDQGWMDLPTNAGVYDLLTLQNDVSATLVNIGVLPAGHINQLRLILGDENTVMVDSLYYPLATPSAQQSGLKINLNTDFAPNSEYELVLDFDAEKSIVTQGNGSYSLKPVIKVLSINPL